MLHYGKLLVLTTLVALLPGLGARAQQENDRRPEPRGVGSSVRTVEGSDLAKDNLRRVAASSAQIQSVLARDAGILVELKIWVAKEATDNGQVVDDSMLTDQASDDLSGVDAYSHFECHVKALSGLAHGIELGQRLPHAFAGTRRRARVGLGAAAHRP